MNRYITPPEYAAMLGVKPAHVLGWIDRGELRAVNTSNGSRPRWKIPPDAIVEFERSRGSRPEVPRRAVSGGKRRVRGDVIRFF